MCSCELLPSKFDIGKPLYLLCGWGFFVVFAGIREIICGRFAALAGLSSMKS